jgi:DNA polymerase
MSLELDLQTALIQQLQSFARSGVRDLPRPRPATTPLAFSTESVGAPSATGSPAPQAAVQSTRPRPHEAAPIADRREALKILQAEVVQCTRCSDLARSRTQTVFGVGNPHPRLCFYGEAPGADEDLQGEPFVGRAGQLLNKIIAACKLTREEVYILNAIKCRPQNNRTPTDDEISNCWNFAARQLEILQPEFICCLGGVAARSLLRRKDSIGRLRQQFFVYGASRVMVTYHPAYLLRDPTAKRYVWDDMKMLMAEMGIPVTS